MLACLMALFQVFKLVCIAGTALVEKALAPFRLHVEVEHGLEGATPAGVFAKFANIFTTDHTTHKHSEAK